MIYKEIHIRSHMCSTLLLNHINLVTFYFWYLAKSFAAVLSVSFWNIYSKITYAKWNQIVYFM